MRVQKKSTHALPLSARGKKRYVLFALRAPEPLSAEDVKRALFDHLLALFGERGVSAQKPFFVGFDAKKQTGILRVALAHTEDAKAALVLFSRAGKNPVAPQIRCVSGTLAKLRQRPDSPE